MKSKISHESIGMHEDVTRTIQLLQSPVGKHRNNVIKYDFIFFTGDSL